MLKSVEPIIVVKAVLVSLVCFVLPILKCLTINGALFAKKWLFVSFQEMTSFFCQFIGFPGWRLASIQIEWANWDPYTDFKAILSIRISLVSSATEIFSQKFQFLDAALRQKNIRRSPTKLIITWYAGKPCCYLTGCLYPFNSRLL